MKLGKLSLRRRRRSLGELSFVEFIKVLESNHDDESSKLAEELSKVPIFLAMYEKQSSGRTVSLSDIERMKWKEVRFQLDIIQESQKQTIDALSKMIEVASRSPQLEGDWTGEFVQAVV